MTKEIIVAAGSVIIEDSKVLLVKHGDDKLWKFPGGKVENNDIKNWPDSLEETAIREAKEELGTDINIIRALKPMYLPKSNKIDKYVVLIHFLAIRMGDIKPGIDINEYKWWSINNLPIDISPNIKPVLASINNK